MNALPLLILINLIDCSIVRFIACDSMRHDIVSHYDERLKRLNMDRLYFDLSWCYKILFGLVRVDGDGSFESRSTSTRGRGLELGGYQIFKIDTIF